MNRPEIPSRQTRVLVVDPDASRHQTIRRLLLRRPDRPELIASAAAEAAAETLAAGAVDAMLIVLPSFPAEEAGMRTFEQLHRQFPLTPAILLAGDDCPHRASLAVARGAQDVLSLVDLRPQALMRALLCAIQRNRRRIDSLRASESAFHALSGSEVIGTVVLDQAGRTLLTNSRMRQMLAADERTLRDAAFSSFLLRQDAARFSRELDALRTGSRPGGEIDLALRRADGHTVWTRASGSVIRGDDGPYLVWSFSDDTERRGSERQLRHENRRLAAFNRAAARSIDDVSHEFRTPLTVIREFASLLAEGASGSVNPQQIRQLRMIEDAAGDLAHLADDLLDSSRIRAGALPVHRRGVHIHRLLEDVWGVLACKADVAGVPLARQVPENLPEVLADAGKARRTLINLVVNAIKFSPPGSPVVVSASRAGQEVRLCVSDQGPGLAKQDLEVIFRRFRQVQSAAPTRSKGFGLGLSIASELAWLNLGRIDVDSTPGAGSRFGFSLPLNRPAAILSSWICRLGELRRAPRQVAACWVHVRPGSQDAQTLQAIASICRPTELLLPHREDRWLLTGPWHRPQHRQDDLRKALISRESTDESAAGISLELAGRWSTQEALAGLLELLDAPAKRASA